MDVPLNRSIILSKLPIVPVKLTTATNVRPPLVAMFMVRGPASRNCNMVRLNVTWPLPCGPPSALYTGNGLDPTGALSRVNKDANKGRAARRAINLAQAVLVSKKHDVLNFPATQSVQLPLTT